MRKVMIGCTHNIAICDPNWREKCDTIQGGDRRWSISQDRFWHSLWVSSDLSQYSSPWCTISNWIIPWLPGKILSGSHLFSLDPDRGGFRFETLCRVALVSHLRSTGQSVYLCQPRRETPGIFFCVIMKGSGTHSPSLRLTCPCSPLPRGVGIIYLPNSLAPTRAGSKGRNCSGRKELLES